MTPTNPRAAAAALLLAFPSLADEAYELPRAQADHAVRGIVECLDADACEVWHLCLPTAGWTPDTGPDDYESLGTLGSGAILATPWRDDEDEACAVRVDGAANVRAVVEHRDSSMGPLSRETVPIQRAGSVMLIDRRPGEDGIAAGWGDCRPASLHNPCPDSAHLTDISLSHAEMQRYFPGVCDVPRKWDGPDAETMPAACPCRPRRSSWEQRASIGWYNWYGCPCLDSPGYAYVLSTESTGGVESLVPPAEVDEGSRVNFRLYQDETGDNLLSVNDAHWRASSGVLVAVGDRFGPEGNRNAAAWRAPRVVADVEVKITGTTRTSPRVMTGGAYCATTSIIVKVRDTDD